MDTQRPYNYCVLIIKQIPPMYPVMWIVLFRQNILETNLHTAAYRKGQSLLLFHIQFKKERLQKYRAYRISIDIFEIKFTRLERKIYYLIQYAH